MLHNPEFWVLVSFTIFFVIFGRTLWAAITQQLDSRADTIRAELAEAAKLRAEAEAMLADAGRARDAALAEAREVLARSKAEAARITEAAALDAAATAKRRERMALDRISAAEKAALNEVRQTAADVAASAARGFIADALTAEHDCEIIDRAIAGLPAALRAA